MELVPEALADTEVSTVSGNVKLKLPRGAGANVEFSSVGGSFNGRSVNLGSTEQKYGNGEHDVEVRTVGGRSTCRPTEIRSRKKGEALAGGTPRRRRAPCFFLRR